MAGPPAAVSPSNAPFAASLPQSSSNCKAEGNACAHVATDGIRAHLPNERRGPSRVGGGACRAISSSNNAVFPTLGFSTSSSSASAVVPVRGSSIALTKAGGNLGAGCSQVPTEGFRNQGCLTSAGSGAAALLAATPASASSSTGPPALLTAAAGGASSLTCTGASEGASASSLAFKETAGGAAASFGAGIGAGTSRCDAGASGSATCPGRTALAPTWGAAGDLGGTIGTASAIAPAPSTLPPTPSDGTGNVGEGGAGPALGATTCGAGAAAVASLGDGGLRALAAWLLAVGRAMPIPAALPGATELGGVVAGAWLCSSLVVPMAFLTCGPPRPSCAAAAASGSCGAGATGLGCGGPMSISLLESCSGAKQHPSNALSPLSQLLMAGACSTFIRFLPNFMRTRQPVLTASPGHLRLCLSGSQAASVPLASRTKSLNLALASCRGTVPDQSPCEVGEAASCTARDGSQLPRAAEAPETASRCPGEASIQRTSTRQVIGNEGAGPHSSASKQGA
mmetsp:Transcript_88886/g.246930  ORF Transcript_88886/g.246930 Transcript_88886/m.246930 type:complete len:512 (+) Transcript_88886:293-1828(+)